MPFEVIALRSDDGCVCPIAQDEIFDRQLQALHRLQVLNIQLEATIAVDADRPAVVTRQTGADGSRQTSSHRAQAGRVHYPLPVLHSETLQEDIAACTRTSRSKNVLRRTLF